MRCSSNRTAAEQLYNTELDYQNQIATINEIPSGEANLTQILNLKILLLTTHHLYPLISCSLESYGYC